MKDMQFPIKYYENNILYNQNNEPWAFYELTGYEYDYLSDNKKSQISSRLEQFFAQVGVETHLLVIPKHHSVRDIHNRFKKTVKGTLKEAAIRHIEEVAEIVEAAVGSEASDYHFYIGIKLPKSDEEDLTFKTVVDSFKALVNEIFSVIGLEEMDIAESEIERTNRIENLYYKIVETYMNARRIDENDFQWLIRRSFYRGIGLPPMIEDFKPAYESTKKGRKPMDILRLTEGIVDSVSEPRKILLSQVVDGGTKVGH